MGFVEYDLIDFVGGSAADWKWVWFLASALICDDIVGVFEWNTMWQNGTTQKFGMIIVSPYGGDWSFCRCHTMMQETIQPLKNLNWGQYNPKKYKLQPMPCYFSGLTAMANMTVILIHFSIWTVKEEFYFCLKYN